MTKNHETANALTGALSSKACLKAASLRAERLDEKARNQRSLESALRLTPAVAPHTCCVTPDAGGGGVRAAAPRCILGTGPKGRDLTKLKLGGGGSGRGGDRTGERNRGESHRRRRVRRHRLGREVRAQVIPPTGLRAQETPHPALFFSSAIAYKTLKKLSFPWARWRLKAVWGWWWWWWLGTRCAPIKKAEK